MACNRENMNLLSLLDMHFLLIYKQKCNSIGFDFCYLLERHSMCQFRKGSFILLPALSQQKDLVRYGSAITIRTNNYDCKQVVMVM